MGPGGISTGPHRALLQRHDGDAATIEDFVKCFEEADGVDLTQFSDAELAVYGIYELQELERVLRGRDTRAMREVADTIRGKIGRPVAEEDDVFLLSYYRQLKARLERGLLLGKRREDKYASE